MKAQLEDGCFSSFWGVSCAPGLPSQRSNGFAETGSEIPIPGQEGSVRSVKELENCLGRDESCRPA